VGGSKAGQVCTHPWPNLGTSSRHVAARQRGDHCGWMGKAVPCDWVALSQTGQPRLAIGLNEASFSHISHVALFAETTLNPTSMQPLGAIPVGSIVVHSSPEVPRSRSGRLRLHVLILEWPVSANRNYILRRQCEALDGMSTNPDPPLACCPPPEPMTSPGPSSVVQRGSTRCAWRAKQQPSHRWNIDCAARMNLRTPY